MPLDSLAQHCARAGFPLSPAQVAAFESYQEALYSANALINLTRVAPEDCESRHFVDSLLFVDLIPTNARVLDLGCGPGFPAWPLACARPDVHVTALDSSGKMLGFLASQPLPNLVCHLGRAEETGWRERFDVVTGRALAPLGVQLELSASSCRVGGIVMPMRTESERESIQAFSADVLGLHLSGVIERVLTGDGAVRLAPIYEKVRRTPPGYPRKWAEIKRHPLRG